MPTLTVPQSYPAVSGGGLNGQRTSANVLDAIGRGLVHLTAGRPTTIPIFLSPRILNDKYSLNIWARRQMYQRTGVLYLFYTTQTPTDYWSVQVTTAFGTVGATVDPTADIGVDYAKEIAIPFTFGTGTANNHTTTSGNVDISLYVELAFRDPYYDSSPKQLRGFSAIIEPDTQTEISW